MLTTKSLFAAFLVTVVAALASTAQAECTNSAAGANVEVAYEESTFSATDWPDAGKVKSDDGGHEDGGYNENDEACKWYFTCPNTKYPIMLLQMTFQADATLTVKRNDDDDTDAVVNKFVTQADETGDDVVLSFAGEAAAALSGTYIFPIVTSTNSLHLAFTSPEATGDDPVGFTASLNCKAKHCSIGTPDSTISTSEAKVFSGATFDKTEVSGGTYTNGEMCVLPFECEDTTKVAQVAYEVKTATAADNLVIEEEDDQNIILLQAKSGTTGDTSATVTSSNQHVTLKWTTNLEAVDGGNVGGLKATISCVEPADDTTTENDEEEENDDDEEKEEDDDGEEKEEEDDSSPSVGSVLASVFLAALLALFA